MSLFDLITNPSLFFLYLFKIGLWLRLSGYHFKYLVLMRSEENKIDIFKDRHRWIFLS